MNVQSPTNNTIFCVYGTGMVETGANLSVRASERARLIFQVIAPADNALI